MVFVLRLHLYTNYIYNYINKVFLFSVQRSFSGEELVPEDFNLQILLANGDVGNESSEFHLLFVKQLIFHVIYMASSLR